MDIKTLKSMRTNLILMAMLELVGGMFMIVFSSRSLEMIVRLLGIVAAAYGVITFFTWLTKKDKTGAAGTIITSVLGIVAGIMLLLLYKYIMGVFTIIAGAFVAIFGILKAPRMFAVKKAGFRKWWIILIGIAAIVALGVIIGLNIANSHAVNSILIGSALIVSCATDIAAAAGSSEVERQLAVSTEIDIETEE